MLSPVIVPPAAAVTNTPAPVVPVPAKLPAAPFVAVPGKAPSVLSEVSTGPTKMVKDGETRLVEPRRVDAHKRAGWALA